MMIRVPGKQDGFSLIELVVGLVITAIALALLSSVFFSNPGRSVEPILQIRATEFGQALMDEILAKKFDHNTPEGGLPACTAASCSAALGSEEGGDRSLYNDVDDYNDYCDNTAPYQNLEDAAGVDLSLSSDNFSNFSMSVCVVYDADYNGVADGAPGNAKLITIDIYPPAGAGLSGAITFSAYKGNY